MDILEKFEMGKPDYTYQRIDDDEYSEIFLGYNKYGMMSLAVRGNDIVKKAKSTKVINVSKVKNSERLATFYFDLVDNSYKHIYLMFCRDLIDICEKEDKSSILSAALDCWKKWTVAFSRKKSELLSREEIKGLIGELLFLLVLMEKHGEVKAVDSWMGPLMGHKDFEIDDTWYEIKSTSQSSNEIKISSVEQLDSDKVGHLVVMRLDESTSANISAINLNKMVIIATEEIRDSDVRQVLAEKLNRGGYAFSEEYDDYNFLYIDKQKYVVSDEFPRISKTMFPNAIGKISYSLYLNGIESFKED